MVVIAQSTKYSEECSGYSFRPIENMGYYENITKFWSVGELLAFSKLTGLAKMIPFSNFNLGRLERGGCEILSSKIIYRAEVLNGFKRLCKQPYLGTWKLLDNSIRKADFIIIHQSIRVQIGATTTLKDSQYIKITNKSMYAFLKAQLQDAESQNWPYIE
ncbi:hypothetical protein Tco_0591091 [Tanacetum coccineum]